MYPEVLLLKNFYLKHKVEIIYPNDHKMGYGLKPLLFVFREHKVIVQIKDEYDDLLSQNSLLNLLLVLGELSFIDESTDFLNWCTENEVDASSEKLRMYYNDILGFVTKFKTYFPEGEIDCFVSDLDFQINAGAAQYLRSN